jgi:hypothetical protein
MPFIGLVHSGDGALSGSTPSGPSLAWCWSSILKSCMTVTALTAGLEITPEPVVANLLTLHSRSPPGFTAPVTRLDCRFPTVMSTVMGFDRLDAGQPWEAGFALADGDSEPVRSTVADPVI